MKWQGRRRSDNVTDARGQTVSGGGRGMGGLPMIINFVLRLFGVKGLLVVGVLGVIAWQMGIIDPATLLGGGGGQVQQVDYQPSAEEEQLYNFVEVVLADTEDVWTREFQRIGRSYVKPELVIYRTRHQTACGMGDARMGPFYCPADQKIYIDLSFYNELARSFDAPGDFAQAYVIAHEVGHHVQTLLGISRQVAERRGQPDYKQYSVRLELQADFLSGLWAHHNRHYLEAGDIEEAMRAANQIGDDAIQSRTQGRINPHAFTHGTSEQRMRWFMKGFESGQIEDSDTFKQPYERL
ncbi:MAG: neutral zinc metallopeptidase [Pseudomonadota bacterium]